MVCVLLPTYGNFFQLETNKLENKEENNPWEFGVPVSLYVKIVLLL